MLTKSQVESDGPVATKSGRAMYVLTVFPCMFSHGLYAVAMCTVLPGHHTFSTLGNTFGVTLGQIICQS